MKSSPGRSRLTSNSQEDPGANGQKGTPEQKPLFVRRGKQRINYKCPPALELGASRYCPRWRFPGAGAPAFSRLWAFNVHRGCVPRHEPRRPPGEDLPQPRRTAGFHQGAGRSLPEDRMAGESEAAPPEAPGSCNRRMSSPPGQVKGDEIA